MVNNLTGRFSKSGPPSRFEQLDVQVAPDQARAKPNVPKEGYAKSLLALFGAASAIGGGVSSNPAMANELAKIAEDESRTTPSNSIVDDLQRGLGSFNNLGAKIRQSVDPHGVLQTREGTIGSYEYSIEPVDMGLRPRWKDGGPALRFRTDLFDTSLSRTDSLSEDWSETTGFTFRVRGELSTYEDPSLDIQAGAYKVYEGPLSDDFQATFQAGVGLNYAVIGEDPGLSASLSARQVVEGGEYNLFGQDFSLYAEARQGINHHFETGESEMNYRAIVGARTQVDLDRFGLPAELDIIAGPQIKGSTDGDSFDPGIGFKVRVNFGG